LKYGFWDPLFYYKEKPALFYLSQDLKDIFSEEGNEKIQDDAALEFKLNLDKEIIKEAKNYF
jgi:hypothetical protein